MGRPSKKLEKQQIILDAYERVILREGFGQASQRKVAEEAEMNQPMLHHYFSGSEGMLDALLDRVVSRYMEALSNFSGPDQSHPEDSPPNLEQMLGFVCSEQFHEVSKQNEVFFCCMIGAGDQNSHIAEKVSVVYQHLLDMITDQLKASKVKNYQQMGYLMMCLILGHDWARKLGFGEGHNDDMTHMLTHLIER